MLGTGINAALVLAGSGLGLLLRGRMREAMAEVLVRALGLCVLGIGVAGVAGMDDPLCVIVCMVAGVLAGEWLELERRLDGLGERLRRLIPRSGGRFTEGFVTASLVYCVGSMAVVGALRAGVDGDHSVLIAKGVIDGVSSVSFAAAMGVGVAFSAVPLLVYQGGLTLLSAAVGPMLGAATVAQMSAVGGVILMGIAANMLGLGRERLRVGNMLPAVFLPVLYVPLAEWLAALAG